MFNSTKAHACTISNIGIISNVSAISSISGKQKLMPSTWQMERIFKQPRRFIYILEKE